MEDVTDDKLKDQSPASVPLDNKSREVYRLK